MHEKYLPTGNERQWYSVDRAQRLIHAITVDPAPAFTPTIVEDAPCHHLSSRERHALKINVLPTVRSELAEVDDEGLVDSIEREARRINGIG